MSTTRDLLITSMDVTPRRPVERGELSLALAGAELLDLADAQALALEDGRIVPGPPGAVSEGLLQQAASSLSRQAPYESVDDWLWRRGRGLYAVHLAALEAAGQIVRKRSRWLPLGAGRTVLADSPARRQAAERWASGDPALAGLGAAAGLRAGSAADLTQHADDTVLTVVAAVDNAVTELAAVRQRRDIEKAAFDNVWRG